MSISMSSKENTPIEVITTVQRRRRWTTEEKIQMVRKSMEPGMSVSLVAREVGISSSQLFTWKRLYLEGGLSAVGSNETVVAASELKDALNRIKQLERALGRKTLENDILKEAVDLAREKNGLRARQYCPWTTSKGRLQCAWRCAQSPDEFVKATRGLGRPKTGNPLHRV